jgi:hypothetical protein
MLGSTCSTGVPSVDLGRLPPRMGAGPLSTGIPAVPTATGENVRELLKTVLTGLPTTTT